MKKLLILILFSFFILNSAENHKGTNGWKLKKDHERFQVYVREKPNSKIDEVQVVALISGTIKEAYDVIVDIGNFPQTFGPHVVYSEIIKKGVDCNSVYLLMNPSFVEKRDTHIKLCTTFNSPNSFGFYWTNISERPVGKTGDAVMMDFSKGGCVFTETSVQDELQVNCEASLDLGGSIPTFAINEINTKAIPQVIWQIYDEIKRRRDFSAEFCTPSQEENKNKKGK